MDLKQLRDKIDGVDQKILELLSKRGQFVQQVAQVKTRQQVPFHVPEREAMLMRNILENNPGPYSNEALSYIFREIISASLALEHPLKVAFLGPEGTFSHQAATQQFGASAHFSAQDGIRQVFEDVEAGRADYGLVPVENSTEGAVNLTLDLFVEFALFISGELQIPIHHQLVAKQDSNIQKIYSHHQALAQCRKFLEHHYPHAELIPLASTALAAQKIITEPNAAAITSAFAAKKYGLNILYQNIEDYQNNYTRFWVIGKIEPGRSGKDKTSLLFSTRDEAGILAKVLKVFADAKINLSRIESRPSRQEIWEYIFFIDFIGHQNDKRVNLALKKLHKLCHYVKILGSYPSELK